jgi:hypothetical protein
MDSRDAARRAANPPREAHDFALGSDLHLNNAMVSRRIVPLADTAVFSGLRINEQAKT